MRVGRPVIVLWHGEVFQIKHTRIAEVARMCAVSQTCQPWPGKNLGNLKLPVAKTWRLVSKTWRSRPTIVGERTVSQGPSHYVNRTT